MKKIAFVLAALLTLSSCGIIIINGGETSGTATTEPVTAASSGTVSPATEPAIIEEPDYESEATARLSSLPELVFDGYSVFITVHEEHKIFFNDDEDAEYRSYILRRNHNLVEKYDFKPVISFESSTKIRSEMVKAKKSGDHYTDLAVIPQTEFGSFASGKVLRNLKTLPYTEFDSDCFEQSSADCFTFGGALYGIVGSAVLSPDVYPCLFARVTESGTDISGTAKKIASGETVFTLEMLNGMLKEGTLSSSVDGTGLSTALFLSFGGSFYGGSTVKPSGNADTLVSQIKNLTGKIRTSAVRQTEDGGMVTYSGSDIFANGLSDFAFGTLADMRKLGQCGFRWEILPVPAYSESTGYITATLTDSPVIVASDTSESVDVPGFILQALNEVSYKCFYGEYRTAAVLYYITSSTALDMTELICGRPVDDKGLVTSSASKHIKAVTTGAFANALNGTPFSTLTEKELTSAQSAFKAIK